MCYFFYMQQSQEFVNTANRWFDGLISKDIEITNEVFSASSVDFDRQVSKPSKLFLICCQISLNQECAKPEF